MTGAERIETILAEQRCRDVHGDTYTAPFCESCRGWAAHVAALVAAETGGLADIVAAAKAEEQAEALHEAADDFMALSALWEVDGAEAVSDWLHDRAANISADQQTSEGSER